MPKDEKADGYDVAMFAMASGELARIKDYVDRGRRFASVGLDELTTKYINAYRSWSENPIELSIRSDACDIDAEFDLRKLEKPTWLVSGYIEIIVKAACDTLDNLSEELGVEIDDEMHDEYKQAQHNKN